MATITTKERVPYRIWDKVNSKWNELKFKTNANSVDAEDGKTLETKVGVINGITSDLSGEADDVAASIKCVNQLNNNLGTFSFYHDPNIVHLVADDKVYSVEDNTYVLADSSTGATLLADTDTYYAKTLAGNYCSAGGADTVVPFTADNNSYYGQTATADLITYQPNFSITGIGGSYVYGFSYTFQEDYKKIMIFLTGGRTQLTSYVDSVSLSNGASLVEDLLKYDASCTVGNSNYKITYYIAHTETPITAGTTLDVVISGNAWYHRAIMIFGIK